MESHSCARAILLGLGIEIFLPFTANAQIQPQIVAVTGTAAPGLPGLTLGSLHEASMNEAGQVIFQVYNGGLTGPGTDSSNNSGIFAGMPNNFQLVYRASTAAPNLPAGTLFSHPRIPQIDAAGDLAFMSEVTGPTFGVNGGIAIYLQPAGGQISGPVAYTGQPVPGAPGVTLGSPTFMTANSSGQVIYGGYLSGGFATGHIDQAIFYHPGASNPGAASQVVAIPTGPAPDTGDTFLSVDSAALNAVGTVAVLGHLTSAGATSDSGIWIGAPTALHLALREGDSSPISGVNFGELSLSNFNRAGQLAVSAGLAGPSVDASNNSALFLGKPGSLQLVARRGSQAPGAPAGVNFDFTSVYGPVLGGNGKVLFTSALAGPNVTSGNNMGLFSGKPGDIDLILRTGDPVPGIANSTFTLLSANGVNESGQISIWSQYTVAGSPVSRNAIFATTPDDQLIEVATTGQQIDLRNGIFKTIQSIDSQSGLTNEAGGLLSFTDDGRLMYEVRFTDGSQALFIADVPEPGLLWGISILGLLSLTRRRRVLSQQRSRA